MLLGFTDPSTHKVWDYPYEANKLKAVETDGLRIYPSIGSKGKTDEIIPLQYNWSDWSDPAFHERKKKSFKILEKTYDQNDQLIEPSAASVNRLNGSDSP